MGKGGKRQRNEAQGCESNAVYLSLSMVTCSIIAQVLFLFSQGIVSPTFTLDHSSNLTNRESLLATIHVLWVNNSTVDS
jgi:hypothetical protein